MYNNFLYNIREQIKNFFINNKASSKKLLQYTNKHNNNLSFVYTELSKQVKIVASGEITMTQSRGSSLNRVMIIY